MAKPYEEKSWNGYGEWTGAGVEPFPCPEQLAVPHNCTQWAKSNCGTYVCPDCDRAVPWCYGASNSPECDDCWEKRETRKYEKLLHEAAEKELRFVKRWVYGLVCVLLLVAGLLWRFT